ncbi:MAG TPA: universal stress protein, partial [Symbiobacteriaceae bacterium]|nr:universal stress protein [Symbiobacteriaceae bacterium]
MKKILLATDGSESSMHAARILGDLIACQPDAQVTVIHVAHLPRAYYITDENGVKVTPEVPMDV